MNAGNYFKIIVSFVTALAFLFPMATAFGVTSPVPSGEYLIMNPGETRDIAIMLQNMAGGEDITLKGYILEGAEYVSFVDQKAEYSIPFNSKDIPINVRVSIPEGAQRYDKYSISVLLRQVVKSKESIVQLASGIKVNLPIAVTAVEPPQKKLPLPLSLPLAAAILVVVGAVSIGGYLAYKKKKS